MKFSLIVPVYNVKDYIERAVLSFVNQTHKDIEIILVDDGSTDGSGELCDLYAEKYCNCKVIHKQNGGVTSAWKEGVKLSSNDYIGFCDPDDWLELNYYEIANHAIESYNCDIFVCGYQTTHQPPQIYKASAIGLTTLIEGEKLENLKHTLLGDANNTSIKIQFGKWIKVIKKILILNNWEYFDESISHGDDVAISIATILDSKSIYVCEEILCYYFIRSDSITHKAFSITKIDELVRLYLVIMKILDDKGYNNDFIKNNESAKMIISLISYIVKVKNSKLRKEYFANIQNTIFIDNLKKKRAITYLPLKKKIMVKLILRKQYFLIKQLFTFFSRK